MLRFDFLDKEKQIRKRFATKIDDWNITVLDYLSTLSIFTSALFALFSIVGGSGVYVVIFSLIYFFVFLGFKFVKENRLSQNSNKTTIYSVVFWVLFISYVILLNICFYGKYPGYLFGMVQILLGLLFQLSFFTTFSISTFSTIIYLLVSFFINHTYFGAQDLLIAITSYSFVLLGSNIIAGTRIVEFENLSKLEKLSTQDSLTKLLNRRSTQYLIDLELAESSTGFLLVIDVDNFKKINDNQGHLVGDKALRELSTKIYELTPKSGVIGRIGGDEFVVFLLEKDKGRVEDFVQNLQHVFYAESKIATDEPVSISIGIAEAIDNDNFDSLFSRADLALYDVKLGGKNGYSFYSLPDKKLNIPTMLIVDDTLVARRLLKSYFENDFNILQAEDGKEALEVLFHHTNVSIIILDMKMPVMSGSQFLEVYKNDPNLSKIPLIVISSDHNFEEEALSMGAKDVILKPFDANIVKIRVENAINLSTNRVV